MLQKEINQVYSRLIKLECLLDKPKPLNISLGEWLFMREQQFFMRGYYNALKQREKLATRR